MTSLDAEFLKAQLPAILGLADNFVIPRQGNWWNAQMLPRADRPMTWCAFAIEDELPVTIPFLLADRTPANWSVQHKMTHIALQFVGTLAKVLASSVGHWINRESAIAAFNLVDGKIMGDSGRVSVVDFYFDGDNAMRAYTARMRVLWASEIPTAQPLVSATGLKGIVFEGSLEEV